MEADVRDYDLGYLLSPWVGEDKVVATVDRVIKTGLTAAGAVNASELAPRLAPLAYPIKKTLEHKSTTFTDAYLGAVRFRCSPDQLAALQEGWRRAAEMVRYLLIQETPVVPRPAVRRQVRPPAPPSGGADDTAREAIDKGIEDLLAPAI